MSRVIKRSNLTLVEPRVIHLSELEEITDNTRQTPKPLTPDNGSNRGEVATVQEEASRILKETEQMVMELLQKARDEAHEIINNSQDEADLILSQAFEEAGKIKSDAQKKGYEEGLRRAHQEIEADRQQTLQQSQQIVAKARQTKLDMFKSCESDMVRLVMAVARRIVAGELVTNPDFIINIIREAIEYIEGSENITVYVNTDDVERVLQFMEQESLTKVGNNDESIEVKGDSRIAAGGCIIESDAGVVDACLETRKRSLEKAVQDVLIDE